MEERLSASVPWLRVARRSRNLSQAQLSRLSGIPQATVSRLEREQIDPGKRPRGPHNATKQALADALGYRVADLFPTGPASPSRELREWARAMRGR
jgi:transcriptional regulator with XRE-family HTH domain